jgi:hypothetical protein
MSNEKVAIACRTIGGTKLQGAWHDYRTGDIVRCLYDEVLDNNDLFGQGIFFLQFMHEDGEVEEHLLRPPNLPPGLVALIVTYDKDEEELRIWLGDPFMACLCDIDCYDEEDAYVGSTHYENREEYVLHTFLYSDDWNDENRRKAEPVCEGTAAKWAIYIPKATADLLPSKERESYVVQPGPVKSTRLMKEKLPDTSWTVAHKALYEAQGVLPSISMERAVSILRFTVGAQFAEGTTTADIVKGLAETGAIAVDGDKVKVNVARY